MAPLLIFILALALILLLTTRWHIHPFLSLLFVSLFVALAAAKPFDGLESILTGMTRVLYLFGIIILGGSIIGTVLDRIGGTGVIADDIIQLARRPVLALNVLGFLVALPVMCCILAYVILIPIAREIAAKQKLPIGVVATALSLGTLASYELVYPAPGVYSASAEFGLAGSSIVVIGLGIAIPTSLTGYFYATRFCRLGGVPASAPERRRARISRLRAYPPLVVPLALIFARLAVSHPLLEFMGNPNIALLLGVLLALIAAQGVGRDNLNAWTREAVQRGGGILMTLCAGGALASTLALTGVGQEIGALIVRAGLPALLIPFLVAVAIQTVQGSRLVTFLVAPSIILPILPELGLPVEVVLLSLAAGTFLVSHANDAYFWAVVELAELTPSAGYRCYTVGGMVLGAVALGLTALIYVAGIFAV